MKLDSRRARTDFVKRTPVQVPHAKEAKMIQARPSRLMQSSTAIAMMWSVGCMTPAFALETIVLENVVMQNPGKPAATVRRIEFADTNLTKEEVQKLFTVDGPKEEKTAIMAKLVASKISIPDVVIADDKGKFTINGIQATGVNAGKVGQFGLAGFEGDVPGDNGRVSMKSGPLSIDGAGFAGLLNAVQTGDMSAASSHFGKFSWQGFEMAAPDKDTPADAPGGNMVKLKFGSVTGEGTSEGDVPLKTTAAIKDLTIELPPSSDAGRGLTAAGYSTINLGFTFSSTYNPTAQTVAIDDLTFSGRDIGSIGLKLGLGGINKSVFTNGNKDERLMSLLGGSVSGLEVKFVDGGAAAKVLAFAAAQQGKTPDALKAETAAMAGQLIPMMLGGHPSAAKIAEQVSAFISNPKGITVSAKPKAGALPFMQAMTLLEPKAFLDAVDVAVLADGAPAAVAAVPAAPAVSAAPAPRPAGPAPAPAAVGRLTGAAAWNALIGNSITGKSEEGDPLTEFYLPNGTVKQLIDDEISTGKWALRGQEICFEYPEDDDETCYKLVVDGNIATFTDEDGAGRRYTVEKGNPKKL
jgi:hypothetical protein